MIPITGLSPTGAARAITVPAVQRGATLRGAVNVSRAGAGGRLDVYVFASPRSLRAHPRHWTRVGRLVRTRLAAGPTRFIVPLGPKVERALRRHSITVVVGVIVRAPRAASAATIRVIKLLR
jgi:hypothetical protein